MVKWRPEGWNVPLEIKPLGECGKKAWHKIDKFSFELGANAILDALIGNVAPVQHTDGGTWVFIPDDTEDEKCE